MTIDLIIAFAPVVFLPLAASRSALSRRHWFAFSLVLFPLLLFITLQDKSITGAIILGLLLSGDGISPFLALILGVYLILVGWALGCFLAGLIYRAKSE